MIVLPDSQSGYQFPPAHLANSDGLLAVGGDLKPERLIQAYRNGIFPWYNEDQPILWWSPDPRTILRTDALRISSSLSKRMRNSGYLVSADTCFADVVAACAAPREQFPDGGTWITEEMFSAYCRLHEHGYAHSIETWYEDRLIGGLYGVSLGNMFFGESMFSRRGDASKIALVGLVKGLRGWGFKMIDCQQPSKHLASLGAESISRQQFLSQVEQAQKLPDRTGKWRFINTTCEQKDFVSCGADIELSISAIAPLDRDNQTTSPPQPGFDDNS